jgi:hypothetical protein
MIFNFLSKKVDTVTRPLCPRCGKVKLDREVSMFAMTGKAGDEEGGGDLPIDESRMESAMESLAGDAETVNEDDPRQAAQLMRKFSKITGMEFGQGMQEALGRLEAGEDPEKIEQEMSDVMEGEEPFIMPGGRGSKRRARGRGRGAPGRDKRLYEM